MDLQGQVVAVSRSASHTMSKPMVPCIKLLAGLGIEGDAHAGVTVKHRSRVARDPGQPNLRQVHVISVEMHESLRAKGFDLQPGQMGENLTTKDIDLHGLPAGTQLQLGLDAVIEITGMRNPCLQLDAIQDGLMEATLDHDAEGRLVRQTGIMAVVRTSGDVSPGDAIKATIPPEPRHPLEPV